MNRPLYEGVGAEPTVCPDGGHAGLWFDKFCCTWTDNRDCWDMSAEEKLRWIKSLVHAPAGGQEQIREQIREYARRQVRMVARLGGRFSVFSTESRFVTGLGRSHPVENGFAWHPTLGTPYLPGSSVKGLLRAWAEQDTKTGADPKILGRVFGERDQVGGICFLDAVPTEPVQLAADIMTPHYAGWSPDDPPGDWRSPTPIPFLVTAEKMPFLFGFTPRGSLPANDLEIVSGWLREALQWAGGGAKTAVGYGRFSHDDGRSRKMKSDFENEERVRIEKREHEELEKTPEGRWRLKMKDRSETEVLDLVRVHLQKEPLADPEERRAFARAVKRLYPDWVDNWRRGKTSDPATRVGRQKLRERYRLINKELAETDSS